LEVRADLAGDLNPDWLRNRFRGRLIYSLRSSRDKSEPNCESRRNRLLRAAASHYDLVELDSDRDLACSLLSRIPPAGKMISWYGNGVCADELQKVFERVSAVTAGTYKLVTHPTGAGDEVAPLSLLKRIRRHDTIAFADGSAGFWTRLIAPTLGAPWIYGLAGFESRLGVEPAIERLIADYGLPALGRIEEIYGIVGNPVSHSLSPRLHNSAYRTLGLPAIYLPFHAESFAEFWKKTVQSTSLESLGIAIKGLTVASPHKETSIEAAGVASAAVRRAGSSNIFVRKNGVWKADTTDPQGVLEALKEKGINAANRKAVVVGCGGSGRAVAAALDDAGADVTLVNRGHVRGELAVRLLGLRFVPLAEFSLEGFSIVVNATPVGREDDGLPFALDGLDRKAVVVDLVYGSKPTHLVNEARTLGCETVDGLKVLEVQVARQFRMMTGRDMPRDNSLERTIVKKAESCSA
jgi:3-dehydroquinate dehydratase/shikimate dehydrogenase